MSDILQNWLLNCLGVNIPVTSEGLGEACFDGTLFAKILTKYNICSHEYSKLISRTVNFETAYSNLKKLSIWFKLLGISYNNAYLSEIALRKSSPALRLLYELFIRLENKESTNFIDWKDKERILSQSTEVFHVEKAPEPREEVDITDEQAYLKDSYRAGCKIIELHQAKEKILLQKRLEESRRRHSLISTRIFQVAGESPRSLKVKKDNFEFNKIIEEYQEKLEKRPCIKEDILDCKLRPYASLLKLKRRIYEKERGENENKELKSLKDSWKEILLKKEKVARDVLAKKLLQQSDYEKKMIYRLKRCRLRYSKFFENKKKIIDLEDASRSYIDIRESFKETDNDFLERKRLSELHKHLYEKKKKERYAKMYEMCKNVVYDMVDLSILLSEWKQDCHDEPYSKIVVEWKLLFIKELPLIDCFDSIKIEEYEMSEEINKTWAELEFYRYVNLVAHWNPKQFSEMDDIDFERLEYIGYIVHKLLDGKYAVSQPLVTPEIKKHNIRLLLRPINNIFVIERLKELFQKNKIAIIDVNSAVSYAIEATNTETEERDTLKPPILTHLSSFGRSKMLNERLKRSILREKLSFREFSTDNKGKKYFSVGCQFPETFEEQENRDERRSSAKEITLSLGRLVRSQLAEGLPISDVLICHLIVDYIKNLGNITGWVLVDFPRDLIQVAILEFMLTGKEVPYIKKISGDIWVDIKKEIENLNFGRANNEEEEFSPIVGSNSISIEQNQGSDIILWKRSEILPKPYPDSPLPFFESFFTKVINVKCTSKFPKEYSMGAKPTSKTDQIDNHITNLEGNVDDFYKCLGISLLFPYTKFVPDTLVQLAGFILDTPMFVGEPCWRNAIDLFGFDKMILIKPQRSISNEKQLQNEPDTPESCNLLEPPQYTRPSIENLVINLEGKKTITQEEVSEIKNESSGEIKKSSPKLVESNVFDFNRITANERAFPSEYHTPLASVWEIIEYFYKFNMTEIFHLLKNLESLLYPYYNYILQTKEKCINLTDDRGILVMNFQLMLNGVSENERGLKYMKNELHCRAFELQRKLWKLADLKKTFSEIILSKLKEENWLERRVTNLMRAYTCLLQAEADRFTDTSQLVLDYTSLCIVGLMNSKRLTKIFLPRFEWGRNSNDLVIKSTKRSSPGKRSASHKKQLQLTLDEPVSIYCEEIIGQGIDYLLDIFKNAFESFKSRIHSDREKGDAFLEECWDFLCLKEKSTTKTSARNIHLPVEYGAAFNDECDRALFRISLIYARAKEDIKNQVNLIGSGFENFKRDLIQQYHVEMREIEKLHDLICAAIEEEEKIQPLLILSVDILSADYSKPVFPVPPPPPPSRLEEVPVGWKFTIRQLENIAERLSSCVPNGLKQTTLTAILQDMALLGHELGHPYLPPAWSNIPEQQIAEENERCFGDRSFVSWKEFIIFGLDLGYPSLNEILEMRTQFQSLDYEGSELLSSENYKKCHLWFEGSLNNGLLLEDDLRAAKAKGLIFKLFQVDSQNLNYTALLLAFSRDEDPVAGFAKALTVIEGNLVIPSRNQLLNEDEQIRQENEKYEIIKPLVNEIIFAVNKIHDVIITDCLEDINSSELAAEYNDIIEEQTNTDTSAENLPNKPIINLNQQELKKSLIWVSDVHVDTVISIIVFCLSYNTSSPDLLKDLVQIRKKIMEIFFEKGDGFTMKFYRLIEQEYVKNLMESYRLFQAISITRSLSLKNKSIKELRA